MPSALLSPILEKIRASREKAQLQMLWPAKAKTKKLRTYQHEDVLWLRNENDTDGSVPYHKILGWAPGLGKTFGSSEAAELPILVSCPATLTDQWRQWFNDEYPTYRVVVASRGDMLKRIEALEKTFDVMIVNHDMFRQYVMPDVTTVIFDEIHHFRNREAARCKGVRAFLQRPNRPKYVYGLTATPVYKDVGDLWHQLHMLECHKPAKQRTWGTYNDFLSKYAVTDSGSWGAKIVRTRNEKALANAIKPFIKERTYQEVGMFLPERIDKHVVLEMDKITRKAYDMLRDYFRKEYLDDEGKSQIERFANAGAVIHELRKILVTDEKIQAIKDIIEDVPADDPVLIFVWYKQTAKRLADELDGIEITGADAADQRRILATTGGAERKRIRVATMASLSEGVDCSVARTVIFAEEDYVPGKNYQAMTRVQRHSTTGDRRPVLAYWLRYANSADEVVHQAARSRVRGNALTVLKEILA